MIPDYANIIQNSFTYFQWNNTYFEFSQNKPQKLLLETWLNRALKLLMDKNIYIKKALIPS